MYWSMRNLFIVIHPLCAMHGNNARLLLAKSSCDSRKWIHLLSAGREKSPRAWGLEACDSTFSKTSLCF